MRNNFYFSLIFKQHILLIYSKKETHIAMLGVQTLTNVPYEMT